MTTTSDQVEPRASLRRLTPFLAALACFAAMALLYVSGARTLYTGILAAWGIDAWPFPFLDTDTILSAVRCLRADVDVFAVNPCDPLGRVYDYSPLWLLLAYLPPAFTQLTPTGLLIDGTFLLSLLLLPIGRDGTATARIVLAVLSPAVVYAVERGNNDLVLFTLAVVAATLAGATPRLRLVGYGAALLAGLLKYYPMTLMALATRERPARFVAVAAASLTAVLLFVATMGHDLARALQLIPTGEYLSAMFGSSTLPGGLGQLFGWPAGVTTAVHLALSFAALAVGTRLGNTAWFGKDLGCLTPRERDFLLIGTLLILSCFFTAQNIGYRATHVLLAVPALAALCRVGSRPRLYGITLVAMLGVLWAQCWRQALDGTTPILPIALSDMRVAGWLLREAMWWWTIAVFIGCVVALLRQSEIGRWVFRIGTTENPNAE